MIHSMTGYATQTGSFGTWRWTWELRAVNGKGFDLRLRLPDWIEGLEASLRPMVAKAAQRGNVSCSLRISREDTQGDQALNTDALRVVLVAMREVEAQAAQAGVSLTPSSAAEIIGLRGLMDKGAEQDDTGPLKAAVLQQIPALLADFSKMRAAEGQALTAVLSGQLDEIARLTDRADGLLETRKEQMANTLRRNLAKVLDGAVDMDESRLAQELALIAVKSDVTEEIDRLKTHITAARDHLEAGGAVGRKLDFLMQEFNREANTLCSKAQMPELTELGLAMKIVIDQMREQVQNVE